MMETVNVTIYDLTHLMNQINRACDNLDVLNSKLNTLEKKIEDLETMVRMIKARR